MPSLWQEPAGLTVIESLASASALITTHNGGIPEIATGRALVLKQMTVADFSNAIRHLVTSDEARKSLQDAAWDDFPFEASEMSRRLANYRLTLIA